MIGTRFEYKKNFTKKPWEQDVRDEKGRKRFHGAFTGGFSAGYFNTVGSKEGWMPKKEYQEKRTIMDYMDDEDIKIGINKPTSLGRKYEYNNNHLSETLNSNEKTFIDNLQNNDKLFLNPLQICLMNNAGYKINDDSIMINKKRNFVCKDDFYGVGYQKTLSEKNKNFLNDSEMSNIVRMNVFEKNDKSGVFGEDDMSNYNFEEVDITSQNFCKTNYYFPKEKIPCFIKSSSQGTIIAKENEKLFKLPAVPPDFKISRDFSQSTSNDLKKANTIEKRTNRLFGKNYLNNQFEKEKDIKVKNQIENYFNFKLDIPFKDDIAKMSRFAKYLSLKEGLKIDTDFTFSKDETFDFEELYQKNQNKLNQEKTIYLKKQSNNATEIKFTLKKEKWTPNPQLYKILKIQSLEKSIDQAKEVVYSELQKKLLKEARQFHPTTLQEKNNLENNTILLNNKIDSPSKINLFDEIFN